MTYSELSDLCNKRKISLTSVATSADMTLRGFRDGMNRQTLGMKAIEAICTTLEITPNQFFGWNESEEGQAARDKQGISKGYAIENTQHKQVQNGGIGNTQHIDIASVSVLQEQIKIKDEQISRLLALLEKK